MLLKTHLMSGNVLSRRSSSFLKDSLFGSLAGSLTLAASSSTRFIKFSFNSSAIMGHNTLKKWAFVVTKVKSTNRHMKIESFDGMQVEEIQGRLQSWQLNTILLLEVWNGLQRVIAVNESTFQMLIIL